ncbi:MAG: hypothetical protein ABSH06_14415 [Thermodesulfobacteriota bacterium]
MMDSWNERIDDLKMKRMIQGEKKHGPLNLETDLRDFIEEALEELVDCLNYLELSMLQGKLPFCKWVSLDRDCRFMILRLRKEDTREA